jgi:hypothetical protein
MNLRKIIREELGDFDWTDDIKPSLRNTIIIFEPMVTETEFYENVVDSLNDTDISKIKIFDTFSYIHHLLIDSNGLVAYGGSNYGESSYHDFHSDINHYVKNNPSRDFNNPIKIDGREFFNF